MLALTDRAELFEDARPRLYGIAYRMLGAIDDAEDLVQETYLRWQQADPDEIRSPTAWLRTVVTRLAIDRARRKRKEREAYVGRWLPEPMLTGAWKRADARTEMESELSMAFLAMLERLAPEERATLLLRDVFGHSYGEIADAVEKSEVACRQMVHRARKRVRRDDARFAVPPEATEQLLTRFLTALEADDEDGVLALLSEDVAYTSDGGGRVPAARRIVRGAPGVARLLVGLARKFWKHGVTHRVASLNGEPGILSWRAGRLYSTTSVLTDGARIHAVYRVVNPDKLRHAAAANPTGDGAAPGCFSNRD